MTFTQIHSLFTFTSICFILPYPHAYTCIFFCEFFGIKLETSCPFTPKYFSMYFLRTKALSYTNDLIIIITIQKFNIAARLQCNS